MSSGGWRQRSPLAGSLLSASIQGAWWCSLPLQLAEALWATFVGAFEPHNPLSRLGAGCHLPGEQRPSSGSSLDPKHIRTPSASPPKGEAFSVLVPCPHPWPSPLLASALLPGLSAQSGGPPGPPALPSCLVTTVAHSFLLSQPSFFKGLCPLAALLPYLQFPLQPTASSGEGCRSGGQLPGLWLLYPPCLSLHHHTTTADPIVLCWLGTGRLDRRRKPPLLRRTPTRRGP